MISIGLPNSENCIEVQHVNYRETFRYSGNIYMRVDSHGLKGKLERDHRNRLCTNTGSLNTPDEVVVIRLSNGRLSYFQRTTRVERVNLRCQLETLDVQQDR